MAALLHARPVARRLSCGPGLSGSGVTRHTGAGTRTTQACLAALAAALAYGLAAAPAAAQAVLTFPQTPPPITQPPRPAGDDQMLLQAREIDYDYVNNRVSAVGNVQMYFGGSSLQADRVVYDQKTKRLRAEGNVQLTEPDGKVTYGQIIDLSDDYRNGFVDSLRLEAPDQTRIAAERADRSGGNFTTFQNGVYTACEPCREDPKKPPLWQVKAARIIHDQGERMIYFEDANLEFFGKPIAYLPYLSTPDPTVKRKTGLLPPMITSSTKYGVGLEVPYFWALAPNYDITLAPKITTKQGPLVQGEYRQRFESGTLAVRAAGLYQLDLSPFERSDGTTTPGYRHFRGSVESSGQFAITDKWVWGWDAIALTDKTFIQDYRPSLSRYRSTTNILESGFTEGISQAYLAGRGERSYFDLRSIYYFGFSEFDNQSQLPVIHPVLDYAYTFKNPIVGGELSYKVNFTSLTRNSPDFDAISSTSLANGTCLAGADPAQKVPANCLLRGVPGNYTRLSAETNWKRAITDQFGQVWTPFVRLRADAAQSSIRSEPGVANYLPTGENTLFRAMPTIGMEYRYPFINVQSWGTQTFEPIAQIIARPNETGAGRFPNEDAQSLVFDDSNLFRIDKYSGWDRVEGGGRANVGVQYTAQFNKAGFFNAMFGQSYHLFGENSFAFGGPTNTGIDSGLDTRRSDYIGRVSYQPNYIYTFTSRARFDEESFAVRRFEAEARANLGRWNTTLLYGSYDAQPELGFLSRRQGILGSAMFKIDANWILTGAARYDINAKKLSQTQIGIGYVDDCFILALNYITDYTYSGNATSDHRIMFQIGLRTIGGTAVSQSVGGP
jgi:LPS-assembly protein